MGQKGKKANFYFGHFVPQKICAYIATIIYCRILCSDLDVCMIIRIMMFSLFIVHLVKHFAVKIRAYIATIFIVLYKLTDNNQN